MDTGGGQGGDQGWQRVFDSKSQRYLFFNAHTQQSRWEEAADVSAPSSTPTPPTTAAAGVWKTAFSKEHNRAYYYNRATQQTSWTAPADFHPEDAASAAPPRVTKRRKRDEEVAALQQDKDRLGRDLQASEVSNLALKDQVAQLKAKLAAAEDREAALVKKAKQLAANEHELSVQLEHSHSLVSEFQQQLLHQSTAAATAAAAPDEEEEDDVRAKLELSQASVLLLEEQLGKLEAELMQKKLAVAAAAPTEEEEQEVQPADDPLVVLTQPPSHLRVKFAVYDRYKDYHGCITVEGDCYDNVGQIRGYLNFASLEAGSKDEDYLGSLYESKFDNMCQVRDQGDEMVAYLDLGTRSVRGVQGNTLVDFGADGHVKHPNGSHLGEFVGAQGYHNMRELTLYLVLVDREMCNEA